MMENNDLIKQILQETLRIYNNGEFYGDFNDLLKTKEECLASGEEDFEVEDMKEFLDKYKFMNIFSYGFNYEIQKLYNSEYLMAGWSYCGKPEELLNFLKNYMIKKPNYTCEGKIWFKPCVLCGNLFSTQDKYCILCDQCTEGERKC